MPKISVKLFGISCVRFGIDEDKLSIDVLEKTAKDHWGEEYTYEFTFKDDEGDIVSMKTQPELEDCLLNHKTQSLPMIKIQVIAKKVSNIDKRISVVNPETKSVKSVDEDKDDEDEDEEDGSGKKGQKTDLPSISSPGECHAGRKLGALVKQQVDMMQEMVACCDEVLKAFIVGDFKDKMCMRKTDGAWSRMSIKELYPLPNNKHAIKWGDNMTGIHYPYGISTDWVWVPIVNELGLDEATVLKVIKILGV